MSAKRMREWREVCRHPAREKFAIWSDHGGGFSIYETVTEGIVIDGVTHVRERDEATTICLHEHADALAMGKIALLAVERLREIAMRAKSREAGT